MNGTDYRSVIEKVFLDPESVKMVDGIVCVGKDVPNAFRREQDVYYKRSPTSVLEKALVWGAGRVNALFNSVANRSAISPTLKAKLYFYTKFLGLSRVQKGFMLDIGCGSGDLAIRLAKSHPRMSVIGIDADLQRLAQAVGKAASKGVDNVLFVHGRMQTPTFRENSFVAVISTQVFEHLAGTVLHNTWRETRKVCTTGGRIVVEVPGDRHNTSNFNLYRLLCLSRRLRERYRILEDFYRLGTYPAFEKHQHYIAGFDEKAFHHFLSEDLCFRNFAYTSGPLTGWAHLVRCLAKYYGMFTYIPEHLLTSIETRMFSRSPGYNLILLYEKVVPPKHVFATEA